MSCDEEICSTYNGFFASTMSNSNIPTIEPLFNQLNPRIKNGSCNFSVLDKPIVMKLVKSLIIWIPKILAKIFLLRLLN